MKPALRAPLQTIDESVNCSYRKLNVAKFVAMCYIPSFHFLSFTLHFDLLCSFARYFIKEAYNDKLCSPESCFKYLIDITKAH